MTKRQFAAALAVNARYWCGSVEVQLILVFAEMEEAESAVKFVDNTNASVMQSTWFEGTTTVLSKTAAEAANAQTWSPSPPPPVPPSPPSPPPATPPLLPPSAPPTAAVLLAEGTARIITALIATCLAGSVVASVVSMFSGGSTFSGGGLQPIIFAVQRFAGFDGLGVPPGEVQGLVASGLGWTFGEVPFVTAEMFSPAPEPDAQSRLLSETQTDIAAPLPAELVTLINLMITAMFALMFTVAIQYFVTLMWRHVINRRYYRHQAAIATAVRTNDAAAVSKAVSYDVGLEPCLCGLIGPKRRLKAPKFYPYPKSLVWPTPVFFSLCIFVTGLCRASVRVLAARAANPPSYCGSICLYLPLCVLGALAVIIFYVFLGLLDFRWKHGKAIAWKPAATHDKPSAVTDPYMRLRAKVRVHSLTVGLLAKNRTAAAQRGLSRKMTHAGLLAKSRTAAAQRGLSRTMSHASRRVLLPRKSRAYVVPVTSATEGSAALPTGDEPDDEEYDTHHDALPLATPDQPPDGVAKDPVLLAAWQAELVKETVTKMHAEDSTQADASAQENTAPTALALASLAKPAPLLGGPLALSPRSSGLMKTLCEADPTWKPQWADRAASSWSPPEEWALGATPPSTPARPSSAKPANASVGSGGWGRRSRQSEPQPSRIPSRPSTACATIPTPKRLKAPTAPVLSPRSQTLMMALEEPARPVTASAAIPSPDRRKPANTLDEPLALSPRSFYWMQALDSNHEAGFGPTGSWGVAGGQPRRPITAPTTSPARKLARPTSGMAVESIQAHGTGSEVHAPTPSVTGPLNSTGWTVQLSPRSAALMASLDPAWPSTSPPPSPPSSAEALAPSPAPATAPAPAPEVAVAPVRATVSLDEGAAPPLDRKSSAVASTHARLRLGEARPRAVESLAERGGHRDRRSGAFGGIPDDDLQEPERTERLLASPYNFIPTRRGDRFQSIEGYLFFRVHGRTRVGYSYRLIVIGVNMIFGVLSGVQPLIPPVTMPALIQTFTVLTLQLVMGTVCFCFLPDADRIISRFAGSQFLLEGLTTSSLLVADRRARDVMLGSPINATTTAPDRSTYEGAYVETDDVTGTFQSLAFALSLTAMGVPMVQLFEQRLITPTINLVVNKGANPLVILAALYMMAVSLPRQIARLVFAVDAGELNAAQAAESATADAGDAVAEQGDGGGGSADADAADGAGAGASGDCTVAVSGDTVADAAARASRLLARGVAAKEAAAKHLAPTVPLPSVDESAAQGANPDSLLTSLQMLARMRAQYNETKRRLERQAQKNAASEDDGGDDDGGGADDIC